MADLTFDEVLDAAKKLSIEEQYRLYEALRPRTQREAIIRETEMLRASGAFDNVESLHGKYAGRGADISAEDLDAHLREIRREWESEIDEFFGDA